MAEKVTLSVGAARADITPDPALLNWITAKPYETVLDKLCVQALAVDDGATEALLLRWDLIDVWEEAAVGVRAAVGARTGIPPERILVHASHSHSTPRSPYGGRDASLQRLERLRKVADDPVYRDWAGALPGVCAEVAAQARDRRQSCDLAIGRAAVPEWVFNRRPVRPDGSVVSMMRPADPFCLPDGLRFGPVDPTLTTLSWRTAGGHLEAVLFHLACHAVSIYVEHPGISADWPGPVSQWLGSSTGAEALFLQGCAGDIVPSRRGVVAREAMAELIIERALASLAKAHPVELGSLRVAAGTVELPLEPDRAEVWGAPTKPAEVQVFRTGQLALVALPGEPLLGLAQTIQAASPYPHTLVLGYSNGLGTTYVGLPGERARGGYEATAGSGADACATILINEAVRLLSQVAG